MTRWGRVCHAERADHAQDRATSAPRAWSSRRCWSTLRCHATRRLGLVECRQVRPVGSDRPRLAVTRSW